MNKLLCKDLKDDKLVIREDSILDGINFKRSLDLHIIIKDNCTLLFNMFMISNNRTINLVIDLYDNSKFIFNNSFIARKKYELNIDTNLKGSNSETDVNMRGINEKDGSILIKMNGIDDKNTKDNVINEYAKIINKGDNANIIIPNLIVNTNEVMANHGASIGTIDKDELFYLKSKGLNEKDASNLLEDGFILSIMDDENKEKIKKYL